MTDWTGREISHYRVVKALGQGGMGIVYLAEDLNIGRKVVLKLLRSDLKTDSKMEERFRREARACASVNHPNISIIYEVNRHDDSWYICMEYVEGQTLRAILRERTSLPPGEVIRMAAATADALGAAHDLGIVHRDIKPENIMLATNGQTKVLDFGLAVFTSSLLTPLDIGSLQTGAERLTAQGLAIGTLHYMSPEQTRGKTVTPAADVFSLGAVIYEALSGLPPFRGDNSLAVMHSISYDNPAPLAPTTPEIPPELEEIVRRALRKDPSQRYATGRIMHAELQRILSGFSQAYPRVTALEPPPTTQSVAARQTLETEIQGAARRFDSELVGREREFKTLLARFDAATAGEGSLVLLAGEAGIGKTRLVHDLARHAEARGARYLLGRCLFREGGLPYHPFVEAAERLIASLGLDDPDDLEQYLRERVPQVVGRLPILRTLLHVGTHESTALIADKDHLLDAISALFLAFARERPMVLHIDDLHWADEATLDLLLYLARNCRQSQGLIIGTYRPEEIARESGPTHPMERLLGRMSAGDLYEQITLARLGPKETASVISSALGGATLSPEFVELLHGETAGNPFYVLETLKLLAEDGALRLDDHGWALTQAVERVSIPGRVHDVVARRLARLTGPDREMLEIASVEGMVFHSDTISTCLGHKRIQVLTALQRAEKEHHLIHSEADGFTFDHPLIREILSEAIIPELRQEYHRLIGEFLAANRRGRPGEEAAIAYQFLEAGQEEAAVPFLLEAGKRARRLYANSEALSLLNRAETILVRLIDAGRVSGKPLAPLHPDALRLYKERGRLHQRLGDHDRAMSDYLAMHRTAVDAGLRDRQAHALSLMADLCYAMGDYDQAFDRAGQAQVLAREAGDKHSLSNSLRVTGAIHFYRGEYEKALAAHNQSIELQKEINDLSGYAENLNKVGNIHLYRGDREKALSVYSAALALARQSGNRLAEAESFNNLGVLRYYGGEAEAALEQFEQCLALKREIGDKRSLARSLNNLALVFEMRGDLQAALGTHRESLTLLRAINDQGSIITGLNNLANVLEKMGSYGDALAAASESLAISEAIGDRWLSPYALNSLGRIRLWMCEPETALDLFQRALEMTQAQGQRVEQCQSQQNLGAALEACGRFEDALKVLQQARGLAQELQTRDRESEIVYLLGLLHASLGDAEDTLACARDLRELAGKLNLPEADIRRLHLDGRAALLSVGEGGAPAALKALAEAAANAARIGLKETEWRLRFELAEHLEGSGADAEITRAATLIEDLAAGCGSTDAAALYTADPLRVRVLNRARGLRPIHDSSGVNRTNS
ncbi:MAG TPA: tetratricopeptide repeat protein [Candidatus Polarisedimenticolia bacterium]|nr:tetratricopeptide repeat protein [Candidatus Polarisedimenticolia bacterium]